MYTKKEILGINYYFPEDYTSMSFSTTKNSK